MIAKSKEININNDECNDDFIMSPKVDFVFKLIFGDENNKDVLIAFLSAVLKLPTEEFEGIELINTELLKEFKEDKKGILDVRVRTKKNEHIDIEIQVLPTPFMAERSLFYWSKMYKGQVAPGETYAKLEKCIAINIVDFERIPLEKIHTSFHVLEDETGYKLTDVLEIHFLELPKLARLANLKNTDDKVIDWLKFLDANSKEGLEMLAEKNENIKTAYEILKRVSKSKEARMAYDARQAEIMDQLTREVTAREEGIIEGIEKGIIEGMEKGIKEGMEKGTQEGIEKVAKSLLDVLDDETISVKTGLSVEFIKALRK